MKSAQVIFGLLLTATMISPPAWAAEQNCSRDLRISKMQADDAKAMEKSYESIYKDARRDNLISTGLAASSGVLFGSAGFGALLAADAGTITAAGTVMALPGITLADYIVTTYHIASPVLIQVFGLGIQAAPILYGLSGVGVLFAEFPADYFKGEELTNLQNMDIPKALQEIETLEKVIAAEGKQIQDAGNYSQILDGLSLGNMDRRWTLRLYNNARNASYVAATKQVLIAYQCQGK